MEHVCKYSPITGGTCRRMDAPQETIRFVMLYVLHRTLIGSG
jgi:hypothetical protein